MTSDDDEIDQHVSSDEDNTVLEDEDDPAVSETAHETVPIAPAVIETDETRVFKHPPRVHHKSPIKFVCYTMLLYLITDVFHFFCYKRLSFIKDRPSR